MAYVLQDHPGFYDYSFSQKAQVIKEYVNPSRPLEQIGRNFKSMGSDKEVNTVIRALEYFRDHGPELEPLRGVTGLELVRTCVEIYNQGILQKKSGQESISPKMIACAALVGGVISEGEYDSWLASAADKFVENPQAYEPLRGLTGIEFVRECMEIYNQGILQKKSGQESISPSMIACAAVVGGVIPEEEYDKISWIAGAADRFVENRQAYESLRGLTGPEFVRKCVEIYDQGILQKKSAQESISPQMIAHAAFVGDLISKKEYNKIGRIMTGADVYTNGNNRQILDELPEFGDGLEAVEYLEAHNVWPSLIKRRGVGPYSWNSIYPALVVARKLEPSNRNRKIFEQKQREVSSGLRI